MTQCEQLMEAFDRGERLTVGEAMMRYGVYALSQRCGEIRGLGYPVDSRIIEVASGKRVKQYFKGGIAVG